MARRWIRLYTELLNDPKVQMLPPDVFKAYINLLCIAGQNDKNGEIPADQMSLAFMLRLPENELDRVIVMLINQKLIDKTENGMAIHGWKSRQYESDTDPTRFERVKRFREKQDKNDNQKVKRVSHAFRNGNETRIDTDTDTDTDTETENINNTYTPTVPDADAPVVETLTPTDPVKKPKAAKTKALVPKDQQGDLYQKILKTFETVSGQFANYGKEGAAIKRIIKLAGDEPTVGAMLHAFYQLTKGNDRFWSRQPYTPSALLSLWDRVKVEAQHELERHDVSWIDELEATYAAG